MPFNPKLKFEDTYKKGDLFYGFSAPREALMKQLKVDTSDRGLSALYTINNYMITGEEIDSITAKESAGIDKLKAAAVEAYKTEHAEDWVKVKDLKYSDPIKKRYLEEAKTHAEQKEPEFSQQLRAPHEQFQQTLRGYNQGKYAGAIGFKVSPKGDKDAENAKQNAAWRKKCKGGIYHGVFVLKVNVHFCLAKEENGTFVEIDHKQVVDKTDPYDKGPSTDPNKLRVITPAELRWIYRHRDSEEVQAKVQFWRYNGAKFEPCGAPWADGSKDVKAAWSSYKPKCDLVHAKVD